MFKDVLTKIYLTLNDENTVYEALFSLDNFKVHHNERGVVNAIELPR